MIIVIECLDGGGKSLQQHLLTEALRKRREKVVTLEEPGSHPLGILLRSMLKKVPHDPLYRQLCRLAGVSELRTSPLADRLLFQASRDITLSWAQRDSDKGMFVILTRSWLSTMAYQGYADGGDVEYIRRECEHVIDGRYPDIIFVLDVAVDVASKRRNRRSASEGTHAVDQFEQRGDDYQEKVAAGLLAEAQLEMRNGRNIIILDGNRPADEIHQKILSTVQQLRNSNRSKS